MKKILSTLLFIYALSAFAQIKTVTTTGGTSGKVIRFTGSSTAGNSLLYDNGTSVSIGNASPTASTLFEVTGLGTIKIPVLTTTQQNALTLADGMIWYNNTLPSFMGYAAGTKYSFVGTSTSNTVNHYPKLITSSTIGDGLLSDDGTNVIVPQNKLISSYTAGANSIIGFGASGNEINLDTKGGIGTHGLFLTNTANSMFWDVAGSLENRIVQSGTGTEIYSDGTVELNPLLTKISSPLQITSGSPGSAKVLTSDASGNATWSAVPAASLSGATGAIVSFSATNTYSTIAAVAAGSYLRSAGTSTLSVWSTLILPNSSTANYVPYATSTNTWGESANMIFNGTTFVIGGGGVVSSELFGINKSQNSGTRAFVTNSNAGTASYADFVLRNGTTALVNGHLGTGYTTGTYDVQDGSYLMSSGSGGISLGTSHASGVIRFYSGGTTERARFLSTGELALGATTLIGAEKLSIQTSTAGAGAYAGIFSTSGTGQAFSAMFVGQNLSNNYLEFGTTNSGYVGGVGASAQFIQSTGAGGLYLQTNGGTNRLKISAAGLCTWTTAYNVFAAGTTAAGTAPTKYVSGPLNTSAEVGAFEFLTDRVTFTTTTGTTRKDFDLLSYRGITALRTLDGSDELVNCTSGTYTVTLPTAVGFTGQYTVKNSGTGIITIATTSSQTVDGYASGVLVLNQYDSYTFRPDNANWIIIK